MTRMDMQKHEPQWSSIYTLIVLGHCGSYTAAATRLGVTKSAVSQRIAELERAAGVALVQRTTRSVRLTEAGARLVESSQGAFEGIARNFLEVQDSVGELRGLIRVTAAVALGRQQIVPRLPAFLKAYPGIRVELELSDQVVSLAQDGFDLAIRHADQAPDTHVAWALCEVRTVLVASQAYLDARGHPEVPNDLARHDCLHYFRRGETASWHFASRLRKRAPRQDVVPHGPFAANNSEALREAALAGLGIALLPDFSAQTELDSGRLVPVLPDWEAVGVFGQKLYAIRPYSPYLPRTVRVFVDYLRDSLREGFSSV
jgi:DNA-binding transcriptional LysR family regulator